MLIRELAAFIFALERFLQASYEVAIYFTLVNSDQAHSDGSINFYCGGKILYLKYLHIFFSNISLSFNKIRFFGQNLTKYL